MELKKDIKQFILYLIVGGLATIVEWAVFYLLDNIMAINYMIATAIAFIISTFANWLFGRIILFQKTQNTAKEIIKIYLTSIAGLIMNLLIMWIAIETFHMNEMLSKIIATCIVFFWNFLIRKLFIYKI